MLRSILIGLLLVGGLASPASAQRALNIPAGFEAVEIGTYRADVTTTWTDINGTNFNAMSTGTLLATHIMAQVVVINTHATQDLFILFRAGTTTATADSFRLEAGQSHTWTGLISLDSGAGVTTMSLQGSAINTTAQVEVWFR